MIEFVLLDLDDTILDFPWAEHQAITRALTDHGIDPTEEICQRYRQINADHWRRYACGEITADRLWVGRFEVLLDELKVQADAVSMAQAYLTYLGQGHCFLPGALETVQELAKNRRLFLVTNGNPPVQYGRLESAGLYPYFEKIFISREIGFHKPQKEFFDHCFANISGFAPERAIMVGDSLLSDIQGGMNAGITTCWVNPRHRPTVEGICPDYQIETLPQLLPILQTL